MTDFRFPPLDKECLRLVADTKEEEEMILGLFFRGIDAKLSVMQEAMVAGAWQEWRAAAHYMKGSASNFGMHVFVQKCLEAESNEIFSQEKAHTLLTDLKNEYQRIKNYLAL